MLNVYYLKVPDYDTVPESGFCERISEETRKTAEGFRCEKVKRLKWLGEGMVRSLLENELQVRRGDYLIKRAEHGKPYICGTPFPVFYNLSHSGDYLVCVLSDREVGIDIQQLGKYNPGIVRRFFHPGEIRNLEQCGEETCAELFFRYWSAKESFLKYTGTGLSASLSGFEILFEGRHVRISKPGFQQQVYIQECQIDKGYKCYVCSEYPEAPEIREFVFAG